MLKPSIRNPVQAPIAADLIRAGIAVHAFNHRDIAGILAMIRTLGALVGTSFGQDATNSGRAQAHGGEENDRNDGFLLELLLTYAPPSVVQNGTSKSDIVSSLQKKELRVKPLSHYAS